MQVETERGLEDQRSAGSEPDQEKEDDDRHP
jgi:hypothetical protein